MPKKICLFILFFLSGFTLKAAVPVAKTDSLIAILQLTDQYLREQKLVKFIRIYTQNTPADSFNTAKNLINNLLLKYNTDNRQAFGYFIESIYQARLLHVDAAENTLLEAIDLAEKNSDHYLLYAFFTQLGFNQVYRGNAMEAVSSYRLANKEAIYLNDPYLEILIDINISDVFYRYDFYSQSLFYLNRAMATIIQHRVNEQHLKNVIYFNKAENYFRMNNIDSLRKYNRELKNVKSGTYKLYTYRNRTDYYLYLLQHDYKNAIKLITAMQKDSLYLFDNLDRKNLADAYYHSGEPDSAKRIIEQLLADSALSNHPELKFHLYDVLGEIAIGKHDDKLGAYYLKLALQQSENNVNWLTQVGNISSQMKIDEMEDSYIQKDELYQKERLWLIFLVIFSILIITVVTIFYRSVKQKRHYEKLLFEAKKQELAFLNSHDVRKHLTNILGIIDVIGHSEDKEKEYMQLQDRLFYSAEKLDDAIKNLSKQLNE